MDKVILTKEGLKYQERTDDLWVETYVTNKFPDHYDLYDQVCDIETGVTLYDVYMYIRNDYDKWKVLFGDDIEIIIEDALDRHKTVKLVKDDMEHIELYWDDEVESAVEFNENDRKFEYVQTPFRLECHGKGKNSNYSFSWVDSATILDYEIKVNEEYSPYYWNFDCETKKEYKYVFYESRMRPTLFQILFGLFDEIVNWGGIPEKRKAKLCNLEKRCADVGNSITMLTENDTEEIK